MPVESIQVGRWVNYEIWNSASVMSALFVIHSLTLDACHLAVYWFDVNSLGNN